MFLLAQEHYKHFSDETSMVVAIEIFKFCVPLKPAHKVEKLFSSAPDFKEKLALLQTEMGESIALKEAIEAAETHEPAAAAAAATRAEDPAPKPVTAEPEPPQINRRGRKTQAKEKPNAKGAAAKAGAKGKQGQNKRGGDKVEAGGTPKRKKTQKAQAVTPGISASEAELSKLNAAGGTKSFLDDAVAAAIAINAVYCGRYELTMEDTIARHQVHQSLQFAFTHRLELLGRLLVKWSKVRPQLKAAATKRFQDDLGHLDEEGLLKHLQTVVDLGKPAATLSTLEQVIRTFLGDAELSARLRSFLDTNPLNMPLVVMPCVQQCQASLYTQVSKAEAPKDLSGVLTLLWDAVDAEFPESYLKLAAAVFAITEGHEARMSDDVRIFFPTAEHVDLLLTLRCRLVCQVITFLVSCTTALGGPAIAKVQNGVLKDVADDLSGMDCLLVDGRQEWVHHWQTVLTANPASVASTLKELVDRLTQRRSEQLETGVAVVPQALQKDSQQDEGIHGPSQALASFVFLPDKEAEDKDEQAAEGKDDVEEESDDGLHLFTAEELEESCGVEQHADVKLTGSDLRRFIGQLQSQLMQTSLDGKKSMDKGYDRLKVDAE